MFEQQPTGKVEDIFADTDKAPVGAAPPPVPMPPAMASGPSKLLLVGLILGVVALGGGGWFAYTRLIAPAPQQATPAEQQLESVGGVGSQVPAPSAPIAPVAPQDSVTADGSVGTPTDATVGQEPGDTAASETAAPAPTDQIAPPPLQPVAPASDMDADGLTDAEEAMLGTDPQKSDSDMDGLQDRDEVRIYKTDPLDADSDGDGYKDGDEVKNGYNPNGPGKLFGIPVNP